MNTDQIHTTLVSTKPKISVITVCKNAAPFIRACIESVINQSYANIEFIIVDGMSTDGTIEIIQEYKSSISIFISEPDNSPNEALNKGFKLATGDILCWLNADDQFWPDALNIVSEVFTDIPSINWITGYPTWFTEDGGLVNELFIQTKIPLPSLVYDGLYKKFYRWSKKKILSGDFLSIQQESVFWRRSLWESANEHIASRGIAFDFELWLRFLQYEQLYSIPIPLSGFRVRDNQLSSNQKIYVAECENLIQEYKLKMNSTQRLILELNSILLKSLKPFYYYNFPLVSKLYIYIAELPPVIRYNQQLHKFELED